MKWAVAGLLVLGLLSGAIAAVLIVFLRTGPQYINRGPAQPKEVTIAALTSDLPAMHVIRADAISTRTVRSADAPAGALTAEQAVGRMTTVPLVAGQVITESALVAGGSEQEFAALLPTGMRYMTISLSSEASQKIWLYPGCLVDVVAAFHLPSGSKGEALSTTLLRSVRVAAVDNRSLVRPPPEPKTAGKGKAADEERTRSERSTCLVTLLVTGPQAEALKLAVDQGTISLAMRNPMDESTTAPEGATVLQGGMLAQMARLMGSTVGGEGSPPQGTQPTPLAPPPSPEMRAPPAPRPPWQIQIFHGDKVETRTYEAPESSLFGRHPRTEPSAP